MNLDKAEEALKKASSIKSVEKLFSKTNNKTVYTLQEVATNAGISYDSAKRSCIKLHAIGIIGNIRAPNFSVYGNKVAIAALNKKRELF